MSTTYPVPGSEGDYPAPRYPDLRIRVVPNESLADRWPHLGELMQALIDVGAPYGVSIEIDTSDRTRPGEGRAGASPLPVLALVVLQGVVDAVADVLLAAAINWVRKHGRPGRDEGVTVRIYGPAGDVLREVRIRDAE